MVFRLKGRARLDDLPRMQLAVLERPADDAAEISFPTLQQPKLCVSKERRAKIPVWRGVGRAVGRALSIVSFLFALAALCACFILWRYGRDLPDYYFLRNYQVASITKIYDSANNLIKEYADERREYMPLAQIPSRLARAFVVAEDKNFYRHFGIDLLGLGKAILINTLHQSWRDSPIGASTITQQTAKIFLVGNERSLTRKAKEAILAFRLEHALDKDRILELYLNQIYLGASSYGVAIAARTYFDKDLADLSVAECALLASMPKAPSQQDPFKNPERAIERRNWVLLRMLQERVISSEEYATATQEPLIIYKIPQEKEFDNSYFLEETRRELIRLYGERGTYRAGLSVRTTLEPTVQNAVDDALRACLERYDLRAGWHGALEHLPAASDWKAALARLDPLPDLGIEPAVILFAGEKGTLAGLVDGSRVPLAESQLLHDALVRKKLRAMDVVWVRKQPGRSYSLAQIPEVTGGAVALDAETGEVLGLSGGYAFKFSQFNCATQAWRQPGSVFKPFVYAAALEAGYTPHSILDERPVSFRLSNGSVYTPHNYNRDSYGGPMSLYAALTRSRNVFTVLLASKIGISKVIAMAQNVQVADYFPRGLSIALGAVETTALRVAGAFAPFINGGYFTEPHLLRRVECCTVNDGSFDLPPNHSKRVLRRGNVRAMKLMLGGVVSEGTAKELAPVMQTRPVRLYGKTGTSNDFKDAWFVCGIVPTTAKSEGAPIWLRRPIVFAVFVGFPTPKPLGQHQTGSKVALPAARYFIEKLYPAIEKRPPVNKADPVPTPKPSSTSETAG